MKRRNFLKGAGAVAVTAALPASIERIDEGRIEPPAEPPPKLEVVKAYVCPRCGSTTSRPAPITIRTDGSDSKRLYGERSIYTTTIEGCFDCRDHGVRLL